jgi:hypothetical protein
MFSSSFQIFEFILFYRLFRALLATCTLRVVSSCLHSFTIPTFFLQAQNVWTNCNHKLLYHFKMSTWLAFLTSCWRITPVSTWRVTSWYGRGVDGVHCCDIVSYRLPSADLREDISTELSIGRGYSRWILRGINNYGPQAVCRTFSKTCL